MGSGNILIECQDIAANNLSMDVQGIGCIQARVDHSVVAEEINLTTTSSGTLALLAETTTSNSIVATSAGIGSVFVGSTSPTSVALFTTAALEANVVNSGHVVVTMEGACTTSVAQSSGAGHVYLHRINCSNTSVALLGVGDIYVNASRYLEASNVGLGTIFAAVGNDTSVGGTFTPIPKSFDIPSYSYLPFPSLTQREIDLPVTSVPTTSPSPTKLPRTSVQPITSGWIAFESFLFAVALSMFAFACLFVVYTACRARRVKKSNDLIEFTQLSTPSESSCRDEL